MAKTKANNYFGSQGTKRGTTYGFNSSLKQDKPAIKSHGNTFGPSNTSPKNTDGYSSTHSKSY